MRVLLTGSTGRLGGAFLSLWGAEDSGWNVRTLDRKEVDLARPDDLRLALERIWRDEPFDVIVNPAAISGLEECLDHPDLAQAVNVDAPRVMAEFAVAHGVKLVHFSTDYVFGGEESGRPSERDVPDPVNAYGQSKLAGEQEVLACSDEALICRVSWLFGPSGPAGVAKPSHFDHVLNRALSGEEQSLIGDKFSVPTYTHDIVGWVESILVSGGGGVYHLCNSGDPESWMSYAVKVCDLARQSGYEVESVGLLETSMKDAHFFRERRPVHTAMNPARLIGELGAPPRHWLEAAEEYLKIR